jgi:hypothetical protein
VTGGLLVLSAANSLVGTGEGDYVGEYVLGLPLR